MCVCVYLQQEFADIVFAFGGSFMQRCELPEVSHVDHGAVKNEQLCNFIMTVGTGVMERNQTAAAETEPRLQRTFFHHTEMKSDTFLLLESEDTQSSSSPFILGVDVGSVLQQELDDCQTVVAGSKMQRRGLPTLHVPAVHVLCCAEPLQMPMNMVCRDKESREKGKELICSVTLSSTMKQHLDQQNLQFL